MDIPVTTGVKLFFIAIFIFGLFSLAVTFYRYMVLQDFMIINTVPPQSIAAVIQS